jgi:O-antigen ligase
MSHNDPIASTQDPAAVVNGLRSAVALAILLAVFITLNPFSDLGTVIDGSSGGGDAPTYAAELLLGAAALWLLHASRRLQLAWLATWPNLALLVWLVADAVVLSTDPVTSGRRLVLCLMTFMLAALLPWLTRGVQEFTQLLLVTAIVVLALCYLGVIFAPQLAIHQTSDIGEPTLAGAWRGIYGHKNIAASVMAVFVYVGWFAARRGRPVAGALVAIAAFVFLINSGGKSATGMVLVVGVIALFIDRARSLWSKALLALGPLALFQVVTVGTVINPSMAALLSALPVDVTFTGRTEIWSFALGSIASHPWKGHGFESFWYSAGLRNALEPALRWMGDVATSHNSYLDLALTIGIPGLVLSVVAFIAAPLCAFHARLRTPQNDELARFLTVLWLFALYLGTFEAFFLSRANPMWFILALAASGLQCTARFRVAD